MGYRSIASIVGLSRDIVRNYCKHHGLDGFAVEFTANVKEQIDRHAACQQCGKPIAQPATGRRKKYCSDECRRQWWTEHQDELIQNQSAVYKLTCVYCGKDYQSYGNKDRKYCSHECYIRDRFWRAEEGRGPYIPAAKRKELTL